MLRKLKDYNLLSLVFFLLAHCLVWTVITTISRNTPNGDTIEAFNWASNLDFGYDKNPYMPGVVAYIGKVISNYAHNSWGYYLLQQVIICFGFLGVYALAVKVVHREKAVISVLLLEGCLYFNVYAQTNNDNYILIGLIPWCVYYFYKICHQEIKYNNFVIFGLLSGLAMMTKYSYLIFLVCFLIYVLIQKAIYHRLWQHKLCIFAGLFSFCLVIVPHIVWLINNQFITINYLLYRSSYPNQSTFINRHILEPINFIWMTICNLTIVFTMFIGLRAKKSRHILAIQHQTFLVCVGILPIIIVFAYYFISGSQVYWEWGVPFVIYIGLIMVCYFDTKYNILRLLVYAIVLMFFGGSLNLLINKVIKPGGSADFPAEKIASYTYSLWRENINTPLKYIGGSRYLAGYIAYYMPQHPKVFNEWNSLYSGGISDCDIQKYGALFVQNGQYGTLVKGLPEEYFDSSRFAPSLYRRFPNLKLLGSKSFMYLSDSKEKTTVLFGIVPPDPFIKCR
ncbi:glycosyltransferase family 39 protein [Cysteiniphilum sp. 6C5]|uniref:glycosyltransferase family 39 protein n=1 Tax=unclassified Cysteiniphilum TaxID=2610889 RepID=UPI003F857B3D